MSSSTNVNPDTNLPAPLVPAPVGANNAVWVILATGSLTVNITTERDDPCANPRRPAFLKGITFTPAHQADWTSTVLPYIQLLTFTVGSTTDVFSVKEMFASSQLPGLYQNVTKVNMSGFHWFSGITSDRKASPFVTMATQLPSLTEISFTLATASITVSPWTEKKMLELETTDMHLARARRVLPAARVIAKYDIGGFLKCTSLARIRLDYVVSDIMTPHTDAAEATSTMRGIRDWLMKEFGKKGQTVEVVIQLAV